MVARDIRCKEQVNHVANKVNRMLQPLKRTFESRDPFISFSSSSFSSHLSFKIQILVFQDSLLSRCILVIEFSFLIRCLSLLFSFIRFITYSFVLGSFKLIFSILLTFQKKGVSRMVEACFLGK